MYASTPASHGFGQRCHFCVCEREHRSSLLTKQTYSPSSALYTCARVCHAGAFSAVGAVLMKFNDNPIPHNKQRFACLTFFLYCTRHEREIRHPLWTEPAPADPYNPNDDATKNQQRFPCTASVGQLALRQACPHWKNGRGRCHCRGWCVGLPGVHHCHEVQGLVMVHRRHGLLLLELVVVLLPLD